MANTCSFFPIDFVKSFDSFLIEDGMSPRDFSSGGERIPQERKFRSVLPLAGCWVGGSTKRCPKFGGLLQPCHMVFEFGDHKQAHRRIADAGQPVDGSDDGVEVNGEGIAQEGEE